MIFYDKNLFFRKKKKRYNISAISINNLIKRKLPLAREKDTSFFDDCGFLLHRCIRYICYHRITEHNHIFHCGETEGNLELVVCVVHFHQFGIATICPLQKCSCSVKLNLLAMVTLLISLGNKEFFCFSDGLVLHDDDRKFKWDRYHKNILLNLW